ncbi:DUF2721 domain-containing protein [Phycisphaera mikurensis]|uniref:DUF2721 domain-containing protein n=1 Tax=Phycisphaera mikurensis (strain NBRC 102666 / KCTC 22515 / FYK2301M01) TaxID=1142394 RepID=I0IBB6_PHYMF|nr:DUF2721 domain-containing protein [Phycisphaera mikurensis]MBB6443048.1 hypothetical protein [Phycisphaera mikurensis]BAM02554.1 hypothetical protein PSMK_03950 [Phycisphaera mikurensis NBRC 102666]
MQDLSLSTPALLFSAISLLLLAYTNRFMGYANLVRTLYERFQQDPASVLEAQIANLRRRIYLTRNMQVLGVASLFLCVASMLLVYVGQDLVAAYAFGVALLLLAASLGVSLYEITISVRSLELHLADMQKR